MAKKKTLKHRFPPEKQLKAFEKKVEKAKDVAFVLPRGSSPSLEFKYNLCRSIIEYMLENDLNQTALAKRLKVNKSRVSEIVNYKVDNYSTDKLMELLESLNSKVNFKIAL